MGLGVCRLVGVHAYPLFPNASNRYITVPKRKVCFGQSYEDCLRLEALVCTGRTAAKRTNEGETFRISCVSFRFSRIVADDDDDDRAMKTLKRRRRCSVDDNNWMLFRRVRGGRR